MSIDRIILEKLWNLIWNRDKEFYLPGILKNGFNKYGINIPPLDNKNLGDIPSFDLFDDPVLGRISIQLKNNALTGFENMNPGSFNYDDNSHMATFGINLSTLDYKGNYEVTATELAGCAVATAAGILNTFGRNAYVISPPEDKAPMRENMQTGEGYNPAYDNPLNEEDSIGTAQKYKEELRKSPSGTNIDEIYIANNEIINRILNANGQFAEAWRSYETKSMEAPGKMKNTRYFANQTYDSAKNPGDENKKVADADYQSHSGAITTSLQFNAIAMRDAARKKGDQDTADKCQKLLDDLQMFFDKARKDYQQPVTVGKVMQDIQNTPVQKANLHVETEEPIHSPYYDEGVKRAKAEIQAWLDKHGSLFEEEKDRENLRSAFKIVLSGDFTDTITQISCSFQIKVTVAAGGESLTLEVQEIVLHVHIAHIYLHDGDGSDLFNKVQNAVANSSVIHSIVEKKIEGSVDSAEVKKGLSDYLNEAVKHL